MSYGLTFKQLRDFAVQYAIALDRKVPEGWLKNNTAGEDWAKGFLKRNPSLSLRKPENTSMARNINFNQANIDIFFHKLKGVMGKYKFPPSMIINVDESCLNTVMPSPNVIAATGTKQVGQVSSAERGESVTFVGAVSADGRALPPIFLVKRVREKPSRLNGAPDGSIELRNSSGWMTKEEFLQVLNHIQIHTNCSKDNPILLLLDNHESHCSLTGVLYARENGIIMLTFPPHTTHRLQPLDVGVFGPFKAQCKTAQSEWLMKHPGRRITIDELPQISCEPFVRAFNEKNIKSSFKKCGIYPMNRDVFTPDDFLGASVTDRPIPLMAPPNLENLENTIAVAVPEQSMPNTPEKAASHIPTKITPEMVRPFPKSSTATATRKGRKKGQCRILTETPEKDRLLAEANEKGQSKGKKRQSGESNKRPIKKVKPLELLSSSEDSFDGLEDNLYDEGGNSPFDDSSSEEDNESEMLDVRSEIEVNDFVVVAFKQKKSTVHFIGQVVSKSETQGEIEVTFLRKHSNHFSFPSVEDKGIVYVDDCKKIVLKFNRRGKFYFRDKTLAKFCNLR